MDFWAVFWTVIGTALTALVTWLTATLTNFINDKIKDRKMSTHATNLLMIVMNAVQCISQTYVSTLKKDGLFNKEAQAEAKNRAIKIVLSEMTPDLIKYVQDNFGDVEAYIATQIESMIYQTKK